MAEGLGRLRRVTRTIRFRLTAAAVLVVASGMLLTSVWLVSAQRNALRDSIDATITQRADDLEELFETGSIAPLISSRGEEETLAQLVADDGTVIAATDNVQGEGPFADTPTRSGDSIATVHDLPVDETSFRLLSRRVRTVEGGASLYVAAESEKVDEGTASLTVSLLVAGPMLTALLGAAAWMLIERAMGPMEAVRREVSEIEAEHLDRRVSDPGTGDEVARLAHTMNELLDRIDAARRRQDQFVGDASHELRSPLTRMRGHLEVDLRTAADSADLAATHEKILSEIGGLEALVDDLLTLARHDARAVSQQSRVDLDDLVLVEVDRLSERTSHEVDLSSVSAAQVSGSAAQLSRAIRNLLDNADQHATAAVAVSVRESDGVAVVTVTDDGPGIPADQQDRIWERFTRLDESRARHIGGAGLGLAITKAIIERHGGSIELDASYGSGARFIMRIPTGDRTAPSG